jgi:hypothetical protein
MSIIKIRSALESAVSGMTPAINTVFENTPFNPEADTNYQRVAIVFASPNNQEYGRNYQEQGILNIGLYYNKHVGPNESDQRVELIRSIFYRGASFSNGGVVTTINSTPEALPGYNDGEYFVRPVRVNFYSNLYN